MTWYQSAGILKALVVLTIYVSSFAILHFKPVVPLSFLIVSTKGFTLLFHSFVSHQFATFKECGNFEQSF